MVASSSSALEVSKRRDNLCSASAGSLRGLDIGSLDGSAIVDLLVATPVCEKNAEARFVDPMAVPCDPTLAPPGADCVCLRHAARAGYQGCAETIVLHPIA
jgi:hypothetical protein